MEEILKSWGLEKLWPTFQHHEITEVEHLKDYFSVSSSEDVKELIPLAGLRARLLKNFSEQFKFPTVTSQLGTPTSSCSSENFTFEVPSNSQDNLASNSEVFVINNDKTDLLNYIVTENNINDLSSTLNIIQPSENLDSIGVAFSTKDINKAPPKKKKKVSDIEYVNLQELLNDHPFGPSVLSYYNAFSELENRVQGRLCDIVTLFYLRRYGMILTETNLKEIAEGFIQLFPNECIESYFIPSETKKNSRSGRDVGAKGKLVNSYKNNCTTIREGLHWEEVAKVKSASQPSPPKKPNQAEAKKQLSQSEESKRWLVDNREVESVLIHWDSSFCLRKAEITSKKYQSVADIYKDWPILKDNIGIELIDKDFIKLFGTISLSAVWDYSFDKLVKYFKEKSNNKIPGLDLLDNPKLNLDYKNILQTQVLAHLLAPKSNKVAEPKANLGKNKSGFWRPNPDDCEKSIFVHVKIPGDIEKTVRQKITRFAKLGLQLQPFIIIVGKDLDAINAFYVWVDSVYYQLKSFLQCIEFIIQLSLVFRISYSIASENVWYYLQKGVCKITTDSDVKIPFVLDLINKLSRRS